MAYLHAHPEAVVQKRVLSFDVARQKLAQSLAAVEKGQPGQATELALSAYLDGVEPIEPTLATRDSALMGRIETAMGRYCALLTSNAAMPELLAQVDVIHGLFKEADELLGSSADATAAYLGSLTILHVEVAPGVVLVVQAQGGMRMALHAPVSLAFDPAAGHVFRSDGRALAPAPVLATEGAPRA